MSKKCQKHTTKLLKIELKLKRKIGLKKQKLIQEVGLIKITNGEGKHMRCEENVFAFSGNAKHLRKHL